MSTGKYGKIISEREIHIAEFGEKVKFYGRTLYNPTAQTYLDMGFVELPTSNPPEGYHDEWYVTTDPDRPWRYIIAAKAVQDEPELRRQFSKGELLEALQACGLYEQAKEIYIADVDLQIAFAGFSDIDMDYPACQSIMAQYPELFSEANIQMLLEYITSKGETE